jgi:hypothetical protein
MRGLLVAGVLAGLAACGLGGCAPATFVQGQTGGWKSIELNPAAAGKFDVAWQKTVDTIARDYDISIMDKSSGYLRTDWKYGICGATYNSYRGRLTIKFPDVANPEKIDVKTDAEWFGTNPMTGMAYWVPGFDTAFDRDVYTALSGRLGRTVPQQ